MTGELGYGAGVINPRSSSSPAPHIGLIDLPLDPSTGEDQLDISHYYDGLAKFVRTKPNATADTLGRVPPRPSESGGGCDPPRSSLILIQPRGSPRRQKAAFTRRRSASLAPRARSEGLHLPSKR